MKSLCVHIFPLGILCFTMLCYRDFILSSKKEVGCRVALLGNGKYSETEMSSQIKDFE